MVNLLAPLVLCGNVLSWCGHALGLLVLRVRTRYRACEHIRPIISLLYCTLKGVFLFSGPYQLRYFIYM